MKADSARTIFYALGANLAIAAAKTAAAIATGSSAMLAEAIHSFGLAAESMSLRACLQEVNKARGRRSLSQWLRETRQIELVVILGEDVAALIGLALALAAVLVTIFTGDPIWDALGSIAIGVVLIVVAIGIAISSGTL